MAERLDIHNLVAAALDAYDRIDVLVNNASVSSRAPFLSIADADFDKVMADNVRGPFLAAQAVARQMIAQMAEEAPGGRNTRRPYSIINMSSVEAIVAATKGVTRRIVVNLQKAQAAALADSRDCINLAAWGDRRFTTGNIPVRKAA